MSITLEILFWLAAGVWLIAAVRNTVYVRRLRSLPAMAVPPADDTPPCVSVVIPARNEHDHIERTVRSFLTQQGVDLELIVVDDRSDDGTLDILNRLAREDGRIEPVRIDELTEGWLGKCHALHTGAARARGDWLLFADADTTLCAPGVIRRAVDLARREQADQVCLFPRLGARTLWAKAAACAFLMGAADRLDHINRGLPRAYFGMGAFNMIRAETYRSFGGHTPLRMEVLDDVNLGALTLRAGGRARMRLAFDAVETTWGATIPELVAALEKNMFTIVHYRASLLIALTGLFMLIWLVAALGPAWSIATGSWAPTVAFFAMLLNAVPASIIARRFGWPRWIGALATWVMIALFFAGVRSMILTLRRGGVAWRGTSYPLAQLRRERLR